MRNTQLLASLTPLILAIIPSLCGTAIIWSFVQWHSTGHLDPILFYAVYFSVTSITMTLALTPTTMVAIGAGYMLGWPSFSLLVCSYMLAAFLSAYTNRFLLKKMIRYNASGDKKIAPILKYFEGRYFLLVSLMRLSPILPFAVTNYVLSALPLKKTSYLSASLIGMLPRTLAVFWAGTIATDLWQYIKHPSGSGALQFIPFALLIISTAGLVIMTKKAIDKAKL